MDESGDHGLTVVNPQFPVFVLCGVIMSEEDYVNLQDEFDYIKNDLWGSPNVIFHSRDIRKCEKEFVILLDHEKKRRFYQHIDRMVKGNPYTIIASAIDKDEYISRYGRLSDDVYETSLSFIVERTVFFLDDLQFTKRRCTEIEIIIEQRGKKEDTKLANHFRRLCNRGTYYVAGERIQAYKFDITFRPKRANLAGLQLSDLLAYPIANHVIDPIRVNLPYDAIEQKIYRSGSQYFGLKIFP